MKYIFIVNGAAGSRKKNPYFPHIDALCRRLNLDYEIIYTQAPGDATKIATAHSGSDYTLLAVGGDGTAYEVLNGLDAASTAMAILPCGTGNDYYRMIGSRKKPAEQLLEETLTGKTVKVDYGQSDYSRFLNVTSFGMDASVNRLVCEKIKQSPIPRSLAYAVSAVSIISHPYSFGLHLQTESETIDTKGLLCCIMNGAYYGNGVCPTAKASLQDGVFNLCVVDAVKTSRLPFLLVKYMGGKGESIKEAHYLTAKKVEITTDSSVDVQSDGEQFAATSISFEIKPAGLSLLVPADSLLH